MAIDKNAFFARTMHTPDSPERAALRESLRELSRVLIPLHRQLIQAAKSDYAFAYGPVDRPAALLELVKNDPFFAWLRPLTTIIVEIDEIARTDFEMADALAIGVRVERLFGNGDRDAEFAAHYVPILQREVDVAMAHAAVRIALQRLMRSKS
jgi:hypothetical protein